MNFNITFLLKGIFLQLFRSIFSVYNITCKFPGPYSNMKPAQQPIDDSVVYAQPEKRPRKQRPSKSKKRQYLIYMYMMCLM